MRLIRCKTSVPVLSEGEDTCIPYAAPTAESQSRLRLQCLISGGHGVRWARIGICGVERKEVVVIGKKQGRCGLRKLEGTDGSFGDDGAKDSGREGGHSQVGDLSRSELFCCAKCQNGGCVQDESQANSKDTRGSVKCGDKMGALRPVPGGPEGGGGEGGAGSTDLDVV